MKPYRIPLISMGLLLSVSACKYSLNMNPVDPEKTACTLPAVEQNIVGTWHFKSTLYGRTAAGTIPFDAQKNVIDPDSLFATDFDPFPVATKTYTVETITNLSLYFGYTGKLIKVFLDAQNGLREVDPLTVASNECNKIGLYSTGSIGLSNDSEKTGFTLTR